MRQTKKVLCLVLALLMVAVMAACKATPSGTTSNNSEAASTDESSNTESTNEPHGYTSYETDDAAVFEMALGEFAEALQAAQAEVDNVSLRYAMMAIAEAKLLESATFMPSTANGGNYAISRVAPGLVTGTLWGSDSSRYHQLLIVNGDPLTSEERSEMKAKWNELKGTGTYEAWAKDYLAGKGHTLSDTYNLAYSGEPATWDIADTQLTADSDAIVNTYDGLAEYDCENVLKPALATSWEMSEDGLTYTFHIREGVIWVDNQGRKVADLTAQDFVTGMQHVLDCGVTGYLLEGVIANASEYMTGDATFEEVGVKATDDHTVVYTLAQKVPYFLTMITYNPFAPINKAYFESKGGVLGLEEWNALEECAYGTSHENIAYCGPYRVTSCVAEHSIVFEANESYWNKDNINIKKINWKYNDGKDSEGIYQNMKDGVLTACGLDSTRLELAKKDGWFEKYHYATSTDATAFGSFLNLRREAYVNVNDETVGVSTLTEEQKVAANAAMQNVHFRRALMASIDRTAYNAQVVGDELAAVSLINSYTPGNFVSLSEEVTIKINGKDTKFEAGTYYGAIVQAQLTADGIPFKVWDPEAEEGAGSSAGYDGWYNVDYAKSEFAIAIAELGEISADSPIVLEMPYMSANDAYANRANVFKQCIEAMSDGKVKVELVDVVNTRGWYFAGYYCESGDQCNYNIYDASGWGPDYGDPQTYLNTLGGENGDLIHVLGIY